MKKIPVLLCVVLLYCTTASAQLTESLLNTFKPRMIGPAVMGGRTVDFAVYEEDPSIFYAASAGGGLLKTVNGGNTWENVFDRETSVSIGDVAINPSDPNVVWVGTGEANNRQSSSWGDGIYKSTDGGKTWKNMGLRESDHIGRIVVNPQDTDIVYVAALGHLWGANPERGVYMTTDGGLNWKQVLGINGDTGAVDLVMDPANPKVLLAAAYQRRRSGWGFNGGGPWSGIYKTVDGGRTWRKITAGLPTGDTGRIGLDIYRKDSNIVYATIENRNGGVFRSEDKGETWTKVSSVNPRPMYFSQIRIDPNDKSRIYVCGVDLYVSDDGGKTLTPTGSPGVHSDHHGLWIDPRNSRHLIDGNDGGIWESRDRGLTWDHFNNYPTGQFYNVSVDMQQPYNIYGGMQDNASWGGPSAVRDRQGIANDHWYQMLSCDGMFASVDPNDSDTIYTDCQDGRIVRYDKKSGERKPIQPQPAAGEANLRWNWTTPIVVSPHDSKTLYIGGNRLFKSTDRGSTWSAISPDLTTQTDRDSLTLMDTPAKDITLSKNDGMSSFGNITAIAESPRRAELVYVGTDDGNLQITRDGGRTWANLTGNVRGVPKMIYVSRVTPSAFNDGTVYVSFDGHRSDDFKPYVYVSTDFGNTWRSITSNLPGGSVYTIKEDPKNQNLLYAGTEFGLFASLDRGSTWTRWSSLPTVAVFDLVVHPRDNDLVMATHGRSIVVFDDISPVQQANETVLSSAFHLFDIRQATQFIPNENGWFMGGRDFRAPNPEFGAYVNYYLKSAVKDDVKITISDAAGKVIRELPGPKEAGLHRVVWDLRAEPSGAAASGLAGALVLTNLGPFVLPGNYQVKVSAAGQEQTKTVRVAGDPLIQITEADRKKLYDALTALTEMQRTVGSAVSVVTKMDDQMKEISEMLKAYPNASTGIKTSVDATSKEIQDLRRKLAGAGGRGGGGEPGEGGGGQQALKNRIDSLKSDVVGSQSLPTAIQANRLDSFLKELNDAVNQVNAAINNTMPALFKQLNDSNIHPSFGEPLKPVRQP